jgi:hypothetical protein
MDGDVLVVGAGNGYGFSTSAGSSGTNNGADPAAGRYRSRLDADLVMPSPQARSSGAAGSVAPACPG